tara:strand:- start:10164 stop:10340 length:177 start_codon:yes stop_codon:yes gene_type:complete
MSSVDVDDARSDELLTSLALGPLSLPPAMIFKILPFAFIFATSPELHILSELGTVKLD